MKNLLSNNDEVLFFIKQFEKKKVGVFRKLKSSLNGIDEVELSSTKGEFRVQFDSHKFLKNEKSLGVGKEFKKLKFDYEDKTLVFNNLFIDKFSNGFSAGGISQLYTEGFSKKKLQYFKLVIPYSKSLNLHNKIEQIVLVNNAKTRSKLGTKIILCHEEIIILEEKDQNDNLFLIMESKKKQSYEEFADKIFAIRVAFGYVTGYFAGNKGYFFSYSKLKMEEFSKFYFVSLREEIKTLMSPIDSNPYAWLSNNKKQADKLYKLKRYRNLSIIEFSKICSKLMVNDDFLATLLLIIESGKASLVFRPSGYSVALETLSDIIIGDKKEKIAPIASKRDSKELRSDLLQVLEEHSYKESFKDLKTLKARIDNINQITNLESLIKPFSILGLDLLEEDLKVIKSRNDFLHGRVPDFKNLGTNRSIDLKDYDLFYAGVRLYTLLNMLIFKMVGFDNYVLNFPKIYEKNTKHKLKEDYYRKL